MRKEVQKRETDQRHVEAGTQRFQLQPSSFILSSGAFSLVEVTIALGIAAFCLIAMLGLLPSGMRNAATASEQTATIGILGDVLSDLKATPLSTNASLAYTNSFPSKTTGGTNVTTIYFSTEGKSVSRALARYAVVTTLSCDAGSPTVKARIKIYWPAAAAETNASGSIESVTVLDRF